MKEIKLDKYAFYKINDREIYQYLPTGKLSDVIYEEGMRAVSEAEFFKDGANFIKIVEDDKVFGIGEAIRVEDAIKGYYALEILKHYSKEDIDYLKNYPKDKVFYLDGAGDLYFKSYGSYCKPNYGEIPSFDYPHDIVNGTVHWYLELYNNDVVSYFPTLCDDKKYRGQKCDYYTFVKVVEYEIDGVKKTVIVGRDECKYNYHPVSQTELDNIIDEGKALISHQKEFSEFAGVSPLYTFNTEDSACVFHDKNEKIAGSVVTTVTGSGDAILDLFLYGAEKVISFDTNSMTRYFAELKFIAAKYLSFDDFRQFLGDFNEDIFRKIENNLSADCQKVWNELYDYSKLFYDRQIKDADKGGLFYPTASIFSSNSTIYNPKGYFNEENYLKLQQIIKHKSLEDITFCTCDLFDLPNVVDLGEVSYVYLSNIMDFVVGVDKNKISIEALERFKRFILEELLPKLKSEADIDLSYIKAGWHMYVDDSIYLDVYSDMEGFKIEKLTNGKDNLLTFSSDTLEKNRIRGI